MAITVVEQGSKKLKTIVVLKSCLGPGGTPLLPKQQVRVPEADAHTLVSGEQARYRTDEDKAEK